MKMPRVSPRLLPRLAALLSALIFASANLLASAPVTEAQSQACGGSLSSSPYTQDFNTLANSGSTSNVLPAGWLLREVGSSAAVDQMYALSLIHI